MYTGAWANLPLIPEFTSGSRALMSILRSDPNISAGIPEGGEQSVVHQMFWYTRWHEQGQPVFELATGVTSALILTNCDGQPYSSFHPPFQNLVVQLPYPQSPISVVGLDGRRTPVNLVSASWFVSAPTVLDHVPSDAEVRPYISFSLLTDGPLFVSSHLVFESTEQSIAAAAKTADAGRCGSVLGVDRADLQAIAAARLLVLNLVLYLESSGQHVPRLSSHREAIQKDFKPLRRVLLGRDVKIAPEVIAAARAFAHKRSDQPAWKLRSRFLVRGHWRQQACGQGLSERRPRWIQPYWKGPESAADAIAGVYHIREE